MSQVKLTADSGGGTVAVKGPSSTSSNQPYTLTLPGTGNATLATTAQVDAISPGITMSDSWRVTSAFYGSQDPISSNWAQFTGQNTGTIGTGLTQSSGVFTFPSTGIYKSSWFTQFWRSGSGVNYAKVYIQVSTNGGSSWSTAPSGYCSLNSNNSGGNWYGSMSAFHVLDCTSTSDVKVRFGAEIETSGCAAEVVQVNFLRLGDT